MDSALSIWAGVIIALLILAVGERAIIKMQSLASATTVKWLRVRFGLPTTQTLTVRSNHNGKTFYKVV